MSSTKKIFLLLPFFLATTTMLSAGNLERARYQKPENPQKAPVEQVDTLIKATESSLKIQKELRQNLVEFQALQEKYLSNSEDKQALMQLALAATKVKSGIEVGNLQHNFSTEFLNEVNLFAKFYQKRGLSKP